MLKKFEKIHLSLKEFRVGYFLVVLFLGLCSCRNNSEKITSLSPSNVEIPTETLNNSSFAKTKGLEYDQHPLIACIDVQRWGFRGINYHLGKVFLMEIL